MTPARLLPILFAFAAPAFATVTVTSPANNQTVGSPAHYVASANSASCGQGVASMGIYVDNQLASIVNGNTLNTTVALSPGAHYTAVEAWDYCGGAATTPVEVTVVNHAGVSVTAPTNNSTVTSPVAFSGAATTACSQGVAAMGVYINNQLVYRVNGASLNGTDALNPGTYNAVVQAWDYCGGAATTPVTFTVAGHPGVAVTSPSNNSVVASPVSYAAAATTACSKGVASIGVYIDNQLAYLANGSSVHTALPLTGGKHNTVVQEWDYCGGVSYTPVSVSVGTGVNIPTWHADSNRSGLNDKEALLSPSNVSTRTFGKLFSYLVDGYVYGQPLLISNVRMQGAAHNVLYAATEKDSVYAFDADSYGNGAPLWKVSLLQSGETPMMDGPIQPLQGVTSTPVIDPSSNTLYVVSAQASGVNSTFRLNALDITTGAQKFGGPVTIEATVPGTNADSVNGRVSLTTACVQRSALLLANGNLYVAFGGCHSGWLLAYNAHTLAQTAVWNASPNANGEGQYASAGGIWMGGGGPAADSAGNVYAVTGNGPWDGRTAWGDSVLKFNAALQIEDFFTPDSYAFMNCGDSDLGAGGLLLIPGTTEALTGGKTGRLYLVNTGNLGKEQAGNVGATQTPWFESDLVSPYSKSCTDARGTHATDVSSYQVYGTAAWFNGSAYLGVSPTADVPAGVRRFAFNGTLTSEETTSASAQQGSYGTTPFVSADGTANGIVWVLDHGSPLQNPSGAAPTSAVLRAYNAGNLQDLLYSSDVTSGDAPGYGVKFSSPVVGNGKVYFATGFDPTTVVAPRGEVDVYGLR